MKRFIEVVYEYLVYDSKENTYSKGTKEKKTYQLDHLTQFLYSQGLQELHADQIKIRHMMLYKEWLRDNTTAKTHEHISRHLRLCSNAMDYSVGMDYADYNCLTSMKLKKDPPKDIVTLDDWEVAMFESYRSERLLWQLVADLYVFMVYTGLGYMDLWLFEIKKEKIYYDKKILYVDLVTCVSGRGKNGRLYWAEFIPKARGIWEKYNQEFPKVAVQTFNSVLRKVAKELGINKYLTTHTGRKTFSNIKDDEGYTPASITKMMGNTEKVLMKHYLKKNKKSLLMEIARVKQINKMAA